MLVDLTAYGLSGKQAEHAMDLAGITCNKNMIPFDKRKPTETSGIRLGSPALTTRGMKEQDMTKIAGWIVQALRAHEDEAKLAAIGRRGQGLCRRVPAVRKVSQAQRQASNEGPSHERNGMDLLLWNKFIDRHRVGF